MILNAVVKRACLGNCTNISQRRLCAWPRHLSFPPVSLHTSAPLGLMTQSDSVPRACLGPPKSTRAACDLLIFAWGFAV